MGRRSTRIAPPTQGTRGGARWLPAEGGSEAATEQVAEHQHDQPFLLGQGQDGFDQALDERGAQGAF